MAVSHQKLNLSKVWISIFLGIFGLFGSYIMLVGADTAYNQIRDLIGTGGTPHSLGTFFTDNGNPGEIKFGAKPTDGYSGAHLFIPETGESILTGSYWMDTVGWTTFSGVTFVPIGQNIWSLSGYAWSESAGWIDFSEATYHLSNTSFSGYAWNDGIGWIDMAGASLDMTSSGAIGKVKIVGNLGGNRIYNTTYDLNGKISPATTTKIVNEVRKNVSLVTRNLPANKVNTELVTHNVFRNSATVSIGNKLVFDNTGTTVARVDYTSNVMTRMVNGGSLEEPIYSVIAIGADIYIDDSVVPQVDGHPRVMIALKNDAGKGGNIYIKGGVTRILSSLVAEGSLYSAEFAWTTPNIYNDDESLGGKSRIPNRQLYIYGSLISNNTIWWYSGDNGGINYCPYDITPCSNNVSLTYDYNHFRDFQKSKPEPEKVLLRWYQPLWTPAPSNKYDDYSMVIEHDPRVISDPPPGLERMQ
jgi:hypothetical protein